MEGNLSENNLVSRSRVYESMDLTGRQREKYAGLPSPSLGT